MPDNTEIVLDEIKQIWIFHQSIKNTYTSIYLVFSSKGFDFKLFAHTSTLGKNLNIGVCV